MRLNLSPIVRKRTFTTQDQLPAIKIRSPSDIESSCPSRPDAPGVNSLPDKSDSKRIIKKRVGFKIFETLDNRRSHHWPEIQRSNHQELHPMYSNK